MRMAIVATLVAVLLVGAALAGILIVTGEDDGLTVAFSNKVCYEPFIIADETGLFEAAGIDVTIVAGGAGAKEALATRSVDVGAMGDSPAMILMANDPGSSIIARYGTDEAMHRLVALDSIESPADLVGKRIGVQLGSSSHGALLQWLEHNEVNVDDVEIVFLHPLVMPSNMVTGGIDAMIGSEPWPTNVENTCLAKNITVHMLGDSSVCNNSFPLVICATNDAIGKKGDQISAMFDALSQAIVMMENDTWVAEVMAERTGLSIEDQLRCTASIDFELGVPDAGDVESMTVTAEFLADMDLISEVPDVEACIDPLPFTGSEATAWMVARG